MERNEVIKKVNEIFIDVMDLDDDFVLTENLRADDIEEWDSLSHIQLIVAIEKEFGIKFSAQEIMKWKNVGEMVDFILEKI